MSLSDSPPPPPPLPPPHPSPARRRNSWLSLYAWFALAYAAQGVFQSFAAFEQPFLASYGVSLEQAGLAASLSQIPWVLKIGFALPSDAYDCGGLGYRRPYASGGLLLGAALLGLTALMSPGGAAFPLYCLLAIARAAGVCASDVATDGLAVDCDRAAESGRINATMTVGRMVGLMAGSLIGGAVADASGFGAMIVTLALLVLAVAWLPPVLLREERVRGDAASPVFEWAALARLRERTVLLFLASACASNAALAVAAFPMAAWQMGGFGFSLTDVGAASSVASAGLLLGSLACAPLFDRVSKRGALAAAGAASAATLLALLAVGSREGVFAARFFAGVAEGALWIVQAGLTMRLADKRAGASFFALMIMAMNFAIMIGQAVAGALAQRAGAPACFALAGALALLQLLPLPWLGLLDVEEADGTVAVVKVAAATAAAALPAAASARAGGRGFARLDEEAEEPRAPAIGREGGGEAAADGPKEAGRDGEGRGSGEEPEPEATA